MVQLSFNVRKKIGLKSYFSLPIFCLKNSGQTIYLNMFRYNLTFQTNLRSLEEGRTLTEDGKKILNLLIEIDQKHIEILRNNMKKLSNDRLIYKLKERLTNVELKLLEDSMSEVDKNQMIIGMFITKFLL